MEFSPMPNASAAPSEAAAPIPAPLVLRPPNPIPAPAHALPPRAAANSKAGWRWFFSGGAAALTFAGVVWFLGSQFGVFGHDTREELPPEAESSRDSATITVTAEPVKFRPVERSVEAMGTLNAYEQVIISPKV